MATYDEYDDDSEPYHQPQDQNQDDPLNLMILKPLNFISKCFLTLSSPFLSIAFESFNCAEEARESSQETVNAVPSRVAEGSALFLHKLGLGLLGATYVLLVLVAVMIFAVVVGVGMVRVWLEEPVSVRETLHFDYTHVHPTALFSFQGKNAVPVTAEVISAGAGGNILARSSHPCMLHFRSLPARLMHEFVLSIPLLLGISDETQIIRIPLLKHLEGSPRTEAIRARLVPRAGTAAVPQVYSAEIIMNSQLPWSKELVHSWKWTFYVWTSFYVYTMCLVVLVFFCKPLLFPTTSMALGVGRQREQKVEVVPETKRDREGYESLRNWQPRRRGRKWSKGRTWFTHDDFPETVVSSATTSIVTDTREQAMRDEESDVIDDFGGFTDGESVYQGG